MCLDEAPVLLLCELGVHDIVRHASVVEPWREVPQRIWQIGILEDQECADHLHPCRACLAAGADDDVVRTEAKA